MRGVALARFQVPGAVKSLAAGTVGLQAGDADGSVWYSMNAAQFRQSGKIASLIAELQAAVAHRRRVAVVFRFAWAMSIVEAALTAHNAAATSGARSSPGTHNGDEGECTAPALPFVRVDAFHKQQVSGFDTAPCAVRCSCGTARPHTVSTLVGGCATRASSTLAAASCVTRTPALARRAGRCACVMSTL